jgi:hypothetical protein
VLAQPLDQQARDVHGAEVAGRALEDSERRARRHAEERIRTKNGWSTRNGGTEDQRSPRPEALDRPLELREPVCEVMPLPRQQHQEHAARCERETE